MHVRAAIRNGLTARGDPRGADPHRGLRGRARRRTPRWRSRRRRWRTCEPRARRALRPVARARARGHHARSGPRTRRSRSPTSPAAPSLTRAGARRFLLTLPTSATCAPTASTSRSRPRVLELGYAYLSSLSASPRSPSRTSNGSPPRSTSPARSPSSTATTSSTSAACRRAGSCAWRSTSAPASPPTPPRWAACCWPRSSPTSSHAYLQPAPIRPLTARDDRRPRAGARRRARPHPRPGLGARRPGARGGPALRRRADPRPRRPRGRRRQRLRARQPRVPREGPQDPAATAAGHRHSASRPTCARGTRGRAYH